MKKDVKTYEQAMQELETILKQLSSPEVTLEESLDLYARAAELISRCDAILKDASLRMETITEALQQVQEETEDDE